MGVVLRYPRHIDAFLRRPLDVILFYPSTFLALLYRRLAIRHKHFIVVIGSLGKTTTTRAIRTGILPKNHDQSLSNYGFRLAENVLRSRPWERYDVFEVGISRPNHMDGPSARLAPNIVVVTSVASDHNRSFATLEDTRAEKVKMVRALNEKGLAILNGDDPNVRWMASQTSARVIYYGFDSNCDIRATDYQILGAEESQFIIHIRDKSWPVKSRLIGRPSAYSVLATVALAYGEKIPIDLVLSRLQAMGPSPGRLQAIKLPSGATLIDDSFKGSLESLESALETISQIPAKRKIVVLGEVEEPPGPQGPIYRALGAQVARISDQLLFLKQGGSYRSIRAAAVRAGMSKELISCATGIRDAIQKLGVGLQEGDLILLKGPSARKYRRILLGLQGVDVQCQAKICRVKLFKCEDCPLLCQDTGLIENYFIKRLLRH